MRADAWASSSHEAYVSKTIGRCGGDLEDKGNQANKKGVYAWIDDGKASCAIWEIPIARIQFRDTKINQAKVFHVKYRKTLYWTFSTGYGVRALEK
jgi:hypothetical protein